MHAGQILLPQADRPTLHPECFDVSRTCSTPPSFRSVTCGTRLREFTERTRCAHEFFAFVTAAYLRVTVSWRHKGRRRKCPRTGRHRQVIHGICVTLSLTYAYGLGDVSRRTAHEWPARFRCEGAADLADRSSNPANCPAACREEEVQAFVRRRVPLWRIAQEYGRGTPTLSRHMAPLRPSRLKSLEPVQPVVRYERALPGELLHIDTKRLGRISVVGDRIDCDRTQLSRGLRREPVNLAIDGC